MTTATDLRARARTVMVDEGQGVLITVQNPAPPSAGALDPATGTRQPASAPPAPMTGFGRVARFSDTLAAAGLIQNGDRKVVFYPDVVPGTPVAAGTVTFANADGSTETLRIVAFSTRELGGEVEHHVIQGRK